MTSAPPLAPDASWLRDQLRRLLGGDVEAPELSWRWWRWMTALPGGHLVLVAPDERAWARLLVEAALITRLGPALDVSVPQVVAACESSRIQVRAMVRGTSGMAIEPIVFGTEQVPYGAARYARDCPISPAGVRLARELGGAVAQIHRSMGVPEAIELGLRPDDSDATFAAIRDVLARVELDELAPALARLEAWTSALDTEPVVCHGDLYLHNLAIDPDTGRLVGIYDFDAACLDHPMSDLRYVHSGGPRFARAAVEGYEAAGGVAAPPETLERFHLLGAFRHLVYVAPDSDRFPRMVRWVRAALGAFAPS